jgi:hypothetical protein
MGKVIGMTFDDIFTSKLIKVSNISKAIYGEKSPSRLSDKYHNIGRNKINSTDIQLVTDFFEKKLNIYLECK